MSQGQSSLQGDDIGVIWDPCQKASRLHKRGFDHSSYQQQQHGWETEFDDIKGSVTDFMP